MKSTVTGVMLLTVMAILLTVASEDAYALVVPSSECPDTNECPIGVLLPSPNCTRGGTCFRTDGNAVVTNVGSPEPEYSITHECRNCGDDCPNVVPAATTCHPTLTVSYTETYSWTIGGGIEASTEVIAASLNASIGHADARTYSTAVTCGPNDLPGCATQNVRASIGVTRNIGTQITSSYVWQDMFYCGLEYGMIEGNSCDKGTRVSTATGSCYHDTSCETISADPEGCNH